MFNAIDIVIHQIKQALPGWLPSGFDLNAKQGSHILRYVGTSDVDSALGMYEGSLKLTFISNNTPCPGPAKLDTLVGRLPFEGSNSDLVLTSNKLSVSEYMELTLNYRFVRA